MKCRTIYAMVVPVLCSASSVACGVCLIPIASSAGQMFLIGHMALSILAAAFLGRVLASERKRAVALVLGSLTAALGGAGALLALVLVFVRVAESARAEELAWLLEPGEDLAGEQPAALVRRFSRLAAATEGDVVPIKPFWELVRFGSLAEKQRVLAQIGKYYDGDLLPALELALSDADNLVRVQAASTFVWVESRLSDTLTRWEKMHLSDPTNVAARRNLVLAQAARITSKLGDPAKCKQEAGVCVESMRELADLGALRSDDMLVQARLLIRLGRIEEARAVVRSAARADGDPRERMKFNEQILVQSRRFQVLKRYRRFRLHHVQATAT